MTPTPEQQAIIDASRATKDNLLINALAGSAKTTTLEMVCKTLTTIPILSLAFNKRIADEMKRRLPAHVQARTMNSLGHEVWSKTVGKRLIVDTSKSYSLVKDCANALKLKPRDYDLADTLSFVRRAKRDGFVPNKWARIGKPVFTDFEEWTDRVGDYPDNPELVIRTLEQSIELAFQGKVDFDDQIYMPVSFQAKFPKYPLLCVDEMQDLNELQHEMLALLYHERLIAVGDPFQSIYAFRGAKQNSMAAARERWNMQELTLSVTFRVPQSGVIRARQRVPHFKWRDGAPVGNITRLDEWSADNVPQQAAIICRNNAPLFSIGLRLLARGRAISLVGMDIGAGLVRVMKKLGPENMSEDTTLTAIETWRDKELKRAKREETVYEKAECLNVLCSGHETLGIAIKHAEALFKSEGPIQLLSGHKAKGLEWNTVFHLDPWRIPSRFAKPDTEDMEQELNVKYVIETRFKEELFLVNLEDFR